MKTNYTLALLIAISTSVFSQAPSIQWAHAYGGSNFEFAYSMVQTSDGGFIMAGTSESTDFDVTGNHGNKDFWVAKTDANGNLQWQGNFGGTNEDIAKSVKQTTDGGYIVAGSTRSDNGDVTGFHGDTDGWVIKLSSSGALQWQQAIGGSSLDAMNAIIQTSSGDYLLVGDTWSNDGDVSGQHNPGGLLACDLWLAQLDIATGNLIGSVCYGGSSYEIGFDIQETTNGFVMAGSAGSDDGDVTGHQLEDDFWVLEIDNTGSIIWDHCYGGGQQDIAYSVKQTTDGGFIAVGKTGSYGGDVTGFHYDGLTFTEDYWIVKLSSNGTLEGEGAFGGTDYDRAYSVIQTSDGGYAVAGESKSVDGDLFNSFVHGFNDFWVLKFDANFNLEWDLPMGGSLNESGYAVVETQNHYLAVCGYANSNDYDVSGVHGGNGWDYWLAYLDYQVGIPKIDPVQMANIFPNPSNGIVTLQTSKELCGEKYTLYNNLGEQIQSEKISSEKTKIDLTAFPAGFYYLQIAGKSTFLKIVKQ